MPGEASAAPLMLLPTSRAWHRSAATSAGAETCCGETSGYQRCCCAQAGLCLLQIHYRRAAGVGEEAPEHPALPPLHLVCMPKARGSRVCTEAAWLPAPREPRAQAKTMKPVQKSCGSNHRPAAGLLPGHDAPGSSSGWGRRGLAAASHPPEPLPRLSRLPVYLFCNSLKPNRVNSPPCVLVR